MRNKFFWLAVLAVAILVGIISCVSQDSGLGDTQAAIIPDVDIYPGYPGYDEYYYEPAEPEETPPPDPGYVPFLPTPSPSPEMSE